MKTACVITVSRADYGLLRWVAKEIVSSPLLQLQLVTAGTHFSKNPNGVYEEIDEDGLDIDYSIPITPIETTPKAILHALGQALPLFADAFDELQPDVVVLLGDRSETLLAAYAATIYGIPIAHIHGGEITAGAIDDAFRHAITKMAHLHFVAHLDYGQRVIQMGERPGSVYISGPLGYESVQRIKLLSREGLERELGLSLSGDNFLVTLHPETLHPERNKGLVDETLGALTNLVDTTLIFTAANQDSGGYEINAAIRNFCSHHPRAVFVESLGTRLYLSAMAHSRAVVGNSSSGIFEAPALGIPAVNIGSRQEGRIRDSSVIDVPPDRKAIIKALQETPSRPPFEGQENNIANSLPEFASQKIGAILASVNLATMKDKGFWDLPKGSPKH